MALGRYSENLVGMEAIFVAWIEIPARIHLLEVRLKRRIIRASRQSARATCVIKFSTEAGCVVKTGGEFGFDNLRGIAPNDDDGR